MRRLQVQEGARLQSGEWQRRDVWVQSARACMYTNTHSQEPSEAFNEKKAEELPSSSWRESQIWLTNLPPDSPFTRSVSHIPPALPFLKINSADWRVCCRRLACFEVVSWEPRSRLRERVRCVRNPVGPRRHVLHFLIREEAGTDVTGSQTGCCDYNTMKNAWPCYGDPRGQRAEP